MYKWGITSLILFASLLGVLSTGSSVSASTIYDDVYQTTDVLNPKDGACTELDMATTWYTDIQANAQITQTQKDSLANATTNGGRWGVNLAGTTVRTVEVYWTEDTSLNLDWDVSPGTEVNVKGNGLQLIIINKPDWFSCNYYMQDATGSIGSNGWSISNNLGSKKNFFVYTDIPNYPMGYQGEFVTQGYTPPVPPLTDIPDLEVLSIADWNIKLHDKTWHNFDTYRPFTCSQGFTPVIQYDLYNNTVDPNTPIDTGTFSPTVPYEFQSENYGVETEYKFIGNYYCGTEDDDPTFSNQNTFYFTVNEAGAFVIQPVDTASCFTDTFPYVDMAGCASVLAGFLNHLSFDTINFPQFGIVSNDCHTLGTIGDWLNVPSSSRTICPQFPTDIRNTVTPFLTFVLGITIAGAIITKSTKEFN